MPGAQKRPQKLIEKYTAKIRPMDFLMAAAAPACSLGPKALMINCPYYRICACGMAA